MNALTKERKRECRNVDLIQLARKRIQLGALLNIAINGYEIGYKDAD
jgi:hypothetical protein